MICYLIPQVLSHSLGLGHTPMDGMLRQFRSAITSPLFPERKEVYDAEYLSLSNLPGNMARTETTGVTRDHEVDDAWDNANSVYDFYRDILGREGIDGKGAKLSSSVRFGKDFDNAFWTGRQMVYGSGSGRVFKKGEVTRDVAIAGHEITHGVIQATAGLVYSGQSGALNESWADALGAAINQYTYNIDPADPTAWMIGHGITGSLISGDSLRRLDTPGKAFNGDLQVSHSKDYRDLPIDSNPQNDKGGVHINSGIPNKAFFEAAVNLGSTADAARIWYKALLMMKSTETFKTAALATQSAALELFGIRGELAVSMAWKDVGVL